MCGIAAFFSSGKRLSAAKLKSATKSLHHRGPDSRGVWLQDTLRGPVLASLPFYDQNKVIALLDQLPAMSDSDRVGWDPVLMSVLSACVLHERFGLDSKAA